MFDNRIALIFALFAGWIFYKQRQPIITGLYETIQDLENEGYIVTTGQTCGERNNNPGNIRPAGYKWQGQTGTAQCGVSGEFIVFSSPTWGIRAIGRDLLTKYGRGLDTVRKIITVYAPPSENDTGAYINSVAKEIGVSPDTVLNLRDPLTMSIFVYAIIRHENGRVIYSPAQIAEGVSMALGG